MASNAFGADNIAATSAQLAGPSGIALDAAGNLYIADGYNNRIRKVSGGIITTVAGNGTAGFSAPGVTASGSSWGLARDSFRYFGARVDVSF